MHPPAANKASPVLEGAAYKAVFSKIDWRLIPLLLIAYMVAYLDRINIGYAQLQMKQTLPFDDAVYGLGAGIFFVGYFLFEVPSNLLLEKIGARKTLLRIMVLWGLAACAMMFVSTPLHLRSTGDNIYSLYFVMALYLLSGALLLLTIRPARAAAGAPVAVPAH